MKAGQKIRTYAERYHRGLTIGVAVEVLLTQAGSLIYEPGKRLQSIQMGLRRLLGEHLGFHELAVCSRNGSAKDPNIVAQVSEACSILRDLLEVSDGQSVAGELLNEFGATMKCEDSLNVP